MAEDKNFYPFKIKIDEEKRRQRIEELKAKFPLHKILSLLLPGENIDDDDEVALENKLRAAMQRELLAIDNAENDNKYQKQAAYLNGKNSKGEEVKGGIRDLADFFAAQDDYMQNHEDNYQSYEIAVAELNSRNTSEEFTPEQKEAERKALDEKYADTIAAHNRSQQGEETKEALEDELERLERNPKEVTRNLLKFYKQCKTAGKEDEFDKIYEEFLADDQFVARRQENREEKNLKKNRDEDHKKDGENNIINEHRFNLDKDGHISHSIRNLNNTGLDISWVDGTMGLAYSTETLSPEQIRALAEYCFYHGIAVEKALKLNDLKVVDKNGKELGTAAEQLQKNMDELAGKGEQSNEKEEQKPKEKVRQFDNEFSSLLGEPRPEERNTAHYIDDVSSLKVNRKAMTKAAKDRIKIMGYHDDRLTKVKQCWNSTIISVYKSENDMLKDGETDKYGNRAHTKEFAVRLRPTNPPRAQIYMEQGKELKSGHARVMLDAFKASGCKYFIIPPADKIGGTAFTAFLEASGKSMMVPLCKSSKKAEGIYLDVDHVRAILKVAKDENKQDVDNLLDFKIRLLKELKKQEAGKARENPKYKTNSQLATEMANMEGDIRFTKFQSTYLERLQDFVNDGLAGKYGEKWDVVDRASAYLALQHVAQDMTEGKLLGKGFDPLDKKGTNLEDMKKSMAFYMIAEKQNVINKIHDTIASSEDVKESKITSAVNKTCSNIEKDVISDYFGGTLKSSCGVEIKPHFKTDAEQYKPSKYKELAEDGDNINENDNHYNRRIIDLYRNGRDKELPPPSFSANPNDELNTWAREKAAFLKSYHQEKKQSGQKLAFEEWRRRRYHGAD